MDIRRKKTYLARNHEYQQNNNYSSFFQTAQKKNFNVDPSSGMNKVGPMFELNVLAEMKNDCSDGDFDAFYPDSSLSFGPTTCSFGLKYNDHNYAYPSGLTPPSMAPHLMDLSSATRERRYTVDSLEPSNHHGNFLDNVNQNCMNPGLQTDNAISNLRLNTSESDLNRSVSEPLSAHSLTNKDTFNPDTIESKNGSFMGHISAGSVASYNGSDMFTGSYPVGSRFMRQLEDYEHIELRSEPELKVIEVPEELAVSPSQLSDLDSDTSDDAISTVKGSAVDRKSNVAIELASVGSHNPVRCVCDLVQSQSSLIKCPHCKFFQHTQCMESYYSVPLSRLNEGYTCDRCGTEVGLFGDTVDVDGGLNQPWTKPSFLSDLQADSVSADVKGKIDMDTVSFDRSSGDGVTPVAQKYVDFTTERVKQLGLIPPDSKLDSTAKLSGPAVNIRPSVPKDKDVSIRPGGSTVDWERLNELSRSAGRPHGFTNVNLRMPSPPRASKRKQDLTSTSYGETETTAGDTPSGKKFRDALTSGLSGSAELSSASMTPTSTPSSTPQKALSGSQPQTPASLSGCTLTPGSEYSSSSGLDSPLRPRPSGDKRRPKPGRALFLNKSRLSKHASPLRASWVKDYQEADSNSYTNALREYVSQTLSAGAESNFCIPPTCLTRSSLCRLVLFDHDEKGLEASIRLAPNEMVTEVRGSFLLRKEYEHFVDPTTEHNRYALFYHGFGDRGIVVDTSRYGNSARFIRRSCMPNCRLEHYVVQGKLILVIRTSIEVLPGSELTIPFDLDYHACRYPLDCACARSRCPVQKWRRKLVRNKVVPNLDYDSCITRRLLDLSRPLSQDIPNSYTGYSSPNLTGSPLVKSSLGKSNGHHQTGHRAVRYSGTPYSTYMTDCLNSPKNNFVAGAANDSVSSNEHPATELASTNDASLIVDCTPTEMTDSVHRPECSLGSISTKSTKPVTYHPSIPSDNTDLSDRSSESQFCDTDQADEKLTFEPIITTRRQAAAMRSGFSP